MGNGGLCLVCISPTMVGGWGGLMLGQGEERHFSGFGLQRMETKQQMEDTAKNGPFCICCGWCCPLFCCFWVPWICFSAANSVPGTCTAPLALWLQVFSLMCVAAGPFVHTFVVCG